MCLEFGRFLPESLVTTFIQNKVVVVRKICINFSRMLFRSLSVQGPPFTLFNRVGWLNVYDGKNLLNTYCGSPLYASPEIVRGSPYAGPEVDCW